MADLAGKTLIRKSGDEVSADEILKNKELILYYFSAHWCPPCRAFTPVLSDFYTEVTDDDVPLEIVYVSSDQNPTQQMEYMNEAHGDWFAVKFADPLIAELKQKYKISGIPTLVVTKKDGTLVTMDGRSGVQTKGAQAAKEWLK
jgi:nucleoredoxin